MPINPTTVPPTDNKSSSADSAAAEADRFAVLRHAAKQVELAHTEFLKGSEAWFSAMGFVGNAEAELENYRLQYRGLAAMLRAFAKHQTALSRIGITQQGVSFPGEAALHLAFALDEIVRGNRFAPFEAMRNMKGRPRTSMTMESLELDAVRYRLACASPRFAGFLDDRSPVKTAAKAYHVDPRTIDAWVAKLGTATLLEISPFGIDPNSDKDIANFIWRTMTDSSKRYWQLRYNKGPPK